MGILNQETLDAANKGFRALFKGRLAKLEPIAARLAMILSSTHPVEDYSWLANLANMKEWLGDRTMQNLKTAHFLIRNKNWECTVPVSANMIEDDQLGLVRPSIESIADAMVTHWDKLLVQFLVAGMTTGLSYDGKAFFATTHDSGSNKGAVTLNADNFNAAVALMMAQKGDDNEPIGVKPTLLVVGPARRAAARTLLKAQQLANGASNINYEEVDLLVTPYISTNHWFVLDMSKPVAPLILQKRSERGPEWITEPGKAKIEGAWGVAGRYNVGYALHQLAYGSVE